MRNVPGSGANGGRRSSAWFDRNDLDGFLHRSWLKSTGVAPTSCGSPTPA